MQRQATLQLGPYHSANPVKGTYLSPSYSLYFLPSSEIVFGSEIPSLPVTSDLAPQTKLADHGQGGGGTSRGGGTGPKSFERKILPVSD